jgi:hypothetical protein
MSGENPIIGETPMSDPPKLTPEQKREQEFVRSQAQMEYLACLAHNAVVAVQALEDEFCGLADWPEYLGKMMPRLAAAAKAVAHETEEWARDSNTDFDPSRPNEKLRYRNTKQP